MKETSFIDQNKKKWNRFEKLYSTDTNNPEELSDLYMDITDDLSYAQTFYKRRTVRVYLNRLAQMVFSGVHKQKKVSFKKFFSVWNTSLPLEIYRSRKTLLFALVVFLLYAFIGAITTEYDVDFARIVLGDRYVDITNMNIEKKNPLAIYGNEEAVPMFIRITTNNLKVAFFTFFLGFFFTFGTHMMLFFNGVMVGTFQYFFVKKGLLLTSFLGIWIHGAFEISAIVLAGGAGITAGNGWLFPGSYSRLQSLQLSTKRGLKIMMSLVPFIIAAGFLESYVTRNYLSLPDWSKWTLILFSFALIVFTYVFYPVYVARKHPELVDQQEVAVFQSSTKFDWNKIRNAGNLIADSFQFYRLNFAKFFRVIAAFGIPLVLLLIFWQDKSRYVDLQTEYWFDWASQLSIMIGYSFETLQDLMVSIGWTFVFTLIFTSVFWAMKSHNEPFSWRSFFSFAKERFIPVWVGNAILYGVIYALPGNMLIWASFTLPFLLLLGSTMALDDSPFTERLKKGFRYGSKQYGNLLGALLVLMAFVVLLAQPVAFVFSIHDGKMGGPLVPDLLDMFSGFVQRVAVEFTDDYVVVSNIVRQLVYLVYVLTIIPLLAVITGFAFFSEREKTEATGLREAFLRFGKRNRFKEKPVDYE